MIDNVNNGWNEAVLVAACMGSCRLDAVVVPNCSSGEIDVRWQELTVTKMVQ